ncbi:hypothetical protein F4819DRAFT_503632 [Hypoxylon fuscum]|nr:hypothetical protein F4819DRAFT_503632 [Hypoxylon fuscum]
MTPAKKQKWMASPTFAMDDVIDPALSSDSSAATAAKRKRASKPKSNGLPKRRIRRIKCDETKPACTRCTSTGRKCDGYSGPAPARRRKPSADPLASLAHSITSMPTDPHLARRHEAARRSFAAACRGSSALRVLRPLAADIEGTEQERVFFHQFRRAAEAGLAVHASSLGPGFWRRLVPLIGNSDPAVRHALIALGASYQSMQLQQEQHEQTLQTAAQPSTPGISSRGSSPEQQGQQPQLEQHAATPTSASEGSNSSHHCINQLELFTIQQYNLSIYHLQRHVQPGSSPESVETTLICCLVFVCIETSRGNEAGALSHVANGLQIIKAMPSELMYVDNDSGSSNYAATPTVRISRSDWRQLLDFFLTLEPSAATYGFTSSLPPTPPGPSVDLWTPSLEYFDNGEMPPQWEVEGAEMEM